VRSPDRLAVTDQPEYRARSRNCTIAVVLGPSAPGVRVAETAASSAAATAVAPTASSVGVP